jgi:hypothetical protein
MRSSLIALTAALLFVSLPVAAADDSPVTRSGPADDEVVLELSVEDWVETTTATVRIAADLAVEAGGFGQARADVVETLRGFGVGATWRIVHFAKLRDDSGFERWTVTAEARVPESALSDLTAKTKQATKPGRALRVANIDYSPTRAEREAVIDALRARIYARAAKEIDALSQAFTDRAFRLRLIDLTRGAPVPQALRSEMAMARAQADAPRAGGGGLAGAEMITMHARVHIAASVPDTNR